MKFTATKKTIVILTVSFLVLILGIISFIYRDFISKGIHTGRWFTLDKYEELLEDCEYSKSGDVVKVNCNALLFPAQELDKRLKTHCYNFIVIPKDNEKKTFVSNLCEGDDRVKWNKRDEWIEIQAFVPVKYSIVFNKTKPFTFEYSSVEIRTVGEKEYYSEFHKNKSFAEVGYYVPSLGNSTPEEYYNYVFMEKNTFGFEEIGHIYTFETQLQKIDVKGKDLQLTFKSTIENEDVLFTIPTRNIRLSEGEGQFTTVTVENKDILKLNGNYQLQFFYLTSKPDSLIEKIQEECSQEDILLHLEPLCGNFDMILEDTLQPTTKDKVIEDLLSGKGEKYLHNTALFYMITIEE